jgi:hypothetical protein
MTERPRSRICRHCRARFVPANTLQVVCRSLVCVTEYGKTELARRARLRARRAEAREHRARLETRQQAAAKAQRAFNRMIRARDAGLPCVSCGHPDDGSRLRVASHYRPAGDNPALRFEPDNVHGACVRCNSWLSGNLAGYRAELVRRIGVERVEWLEGPHDLPHWRVEDLREMAARFAREAREVERMNRARLDCERFNQTRVTT